MHKVTCHKPCSGYLNLSLIASDSPGQSSNPKTPDSEQVDTSRTALHAKKVPIRLSIDWFGLLASPEVANSPSDSVWPEQLAEIRQEYSGATSSFLKSPEENKCVGPDCERPYSVLIRITTCEDKGRCNGNTLRDKVRGSIRANVSGCCFMGKRYKALS